METLNKEDLAQLMGPEVKVMDDTNITYPIIKIEDLEFCKLKIHYEADPDIVKEKITEAVGTLRKAKVPGFRPGKATDQAIKLRLRPQIDQYVARAMAVNAIDEIVFETDIKPIGMPKFSNVTAKGNKFSCDIELAKKPEFEVPNIKFDIPKPHMDTDEEALAERSLLNLRIRVGDSEPYEENDAVEIGDQITFSFEAKIENQPFDGSVVEGEMYAVGTDRWPGFDANILGMKAGEVREFDLGFENGSLAGKTAKFSVNVHMGTKQKPHPIDDEFLSVMGVSSLEELMGKLRTIAKSSIARNEQGAIRQQVALKLMEANPFEIPKFMVDDEFKYISQTSPPGTEANVIVQQAERNVRLSLILDTVRDKEPDSVLSDAEAQTQLIQYIKNQGQDPSLLFQNKQASPQAIALLNSIKDEFTLQWVASQANLVE